MARDIGCVLRVSIKAIFGEFTSYPIYPAVMPYYMTLFRQSTAVGDN
jgi:hypothetical protein